MPGIVSARKTRVDAITFKFENGFSCRIIRNDYGHHLYVFPTILEEADDNGVSLTNFLDTAMGNPRAAMDAHLLFPNMTTDDEIVAALAHVSLREQEAIANGVASALRRIKEKFR